MVERKERYGNGELDLEFQQIAITADDLRSGRLTTHDVNTRDVKYMRFREECLREGIDPHTAVEVEALRPKLVRQRPDEAIEGLADDVRQWNIEARAEEAERELLRSLQGTVKKIVQHTAHGDLLLSWETFGGPAGKRRHRRVVDDGVRQAARDRAGPDEVAAAAAAGAADADPGPERGPRRRCSRWCSLPAPRCTDAGRCSASSR